MTKTPPSVVAVVGGTGFIGREVVRELLAAGRKVRIIGRDPAAARRLFSGEVEARFGDLRDRYTLAPAFDGCDTAVHAVQFPNHPFENPRKGFTYLRIDGEGTARSVAAAHEAGVRRFIYVSGAGAGTDRPEPWFEAKRRAERAVRESGLAYTLVRPSWIYGPGDRALNKFAFFARILPVVPTIGASHRQRVMPIFVKDVARILAACVDHPGATGAVFEVGGKEVLTMNDVVRTMLAVMGKRRPLLPQPKFLMKLPAFFLQFLPTPPLTPAGVDFACQDGLVDLSTFRRLFPDFRLTPLREALSTYLAPAND